ncbi:hypothetical protein SEUCBS140593_000227 [Sporothrix eucalyptigena]|uniref:C2H2-type domain-containing protein n=1 Tax=Sporothrix eucalyptigena TaxID=1812306 RepID=A0ABP0AMY4_9PEZI
MSLGARVVSQKKLPTQEPLAEPRVKKGMFLLPPAPVAAPAIATSKTPSKTPIKAPSKATELPHAMTTKPQSAASQGKEFLQSASGRDYSKSFTGGLGFGILFPDGYKLSKYPGLPWICPVRDCQRVMPGIQNLGAHFTTKHRYSKFNDNGDGTLSTVGRHSSIRSIVVSQNVRPASEMEPLAAQGPVGYKPKETIAPDTSDAVIPAAESTTQATLLSKLSNTTQEQKDEMWDYVKSFVTTGMQRLGRPRTGKAALYFNAPRIRDLRWNEARVRANPNVEPRATHLAAVLIQLTGDYADKPCDHCKGGGGHFEGCVIASSKGAPEMSVAYGSCANCLNGHGRVKCSLSSTARQRFAQRFPHLDYNAVNEELRLTVYRLNSDGGPPRPPTFSDADTAAARAAHEAKKGTINGAGNGAGTSCEIMGKQGAGSSSSAQLTSDNEPLSHRNKLRQSGVSGRVPEPYRDTFGRRRSGRIAEYGETTTPSLSGVRSSLSGQARAPKQRSSPLLFAGNAQLGADALEMEDWEVAPGRVQSTTNDNIAFSNAYLTSSHMVPINHSMSYRVEVVRPGSTFTFDADARATRTCALASGKLCVTVGDSDFVMGPHGMFLVSPGKTFSVQNRLYIDAYLHITALLN